MSMLPMGNLPFPLQVGIIAGAAAVLLGGAFLVLGANPVALAIVAGGIVLVILLLLVFGAFLANHRKRKSAPLSQAIAGNAAAAPNTISAPARRARLDDLRRNFEQGVEKFHAAGKDLYSVPWYVLVGEPGSGKTEAIRHCNVGFPPGLQDQLQGSGGTLNMNWWFTNQAIILDTAGRLMFEEIQTGATNEWQEFLRLLKTSRPNCPINGMLLVIPVDALIKDSSEQIETKAGKIAQQFDQIQRTLGVRFPVFVIITKCDLINGFREFFDDLNDPQLQHQIMGWSNSAPLDERFDPAAIEAHIASIKDRLIERRERLLLDPVNTEDAQARRLDQVDALYALPDSIMKIAPRLRRYLETIFVAGEWSPRPLFLRGIYFTSSMTEGSALDAELAEVLGVPVDSLPEGRVWRRDRAFFLRDLFVEKVFREKGLVTRATSADKQQSRRRMAVLGSALAAVLCLIVLTLLGAASLNKQLGGQDELWHTIAGFSPADMKIVSDGGAYDADQLVPIANDRLSIADFFGHTLPLVQTPVQVPAIFKPMTVVSGSIDAQRRDAFRALFEATILRPAFDATRRRMVTTWNDTSRDALAQLMRLEFASATGRPAPAGGPAAEHSHVDLTPMFKAALTDADFKKYQSDEPTLQKVTDWIYSPAAAGDKAWPAELLAPGTPAATEAVDNGINRMIEYWNLHAGGATTQKAKALADAKTDADLLLKFTPAPADSPRDPASFKLLQNVRSRLEQAVKAWTTP